MGGLQESIVFDRRTTKHLEFRVTEVRDKTNVYVIFSILSKAKLGEIRWNPGWRRYCFFPEMNTVFDSDCLEDIKDFIDVLKEMLDRKAEQNSEKALEDIKRENKKKR